jgi:SSS family solute:Na+ symporter
MWQGFHIKTIKEYAIGNKPIPITLIISTIIVTWIDGGSTFEPAANSFKYGVIGLYPQLGIVVYLYIISKFLAPRMKPFFNMISVGEVMESIYGPWAGFLTAIAAVVRCCGAVGIQIFVMSDLLEYLLPDNRFECLLLSTFTVFLYTAFGGIKSIAIADCLQALIIFFIIPIVIFYGLAVIDASEGFMSYLSHKTLRLSYNKELWVNYSILFIYFSIPSLIPTVIQQMLIAKDTVTISFCFSIAAGIISLYFIMITIVGNIAYEIDPNIKPKYTLIYLVDILPSILILKGIAICALMSIMMSTANSHLNVASVSLINDIFKKLWPHLEEYKLLFILRLSTVFLGIFTFSIAYSFESIIDILIFIEAFWRPTVSFPLILGLFGFRSTTKAFILSSIAGIVIFALINKFPQFNNMNGICAILCGSMANGFTLLIIHYMSFKTFKKIA